jgi:hypothetical protein
MRNINSMMAPEMPTRRSIRQAVVNDEANGKFDHGVRVSRLRWGNMGSVDREMCLTLATVMLGIV